MKTWVVTGGAATGKSSFCRMLAALHSPSRIFSSDACVHALLSDPDISGILATGFGPKVLGSGGLVDRARLREHVFADEVSRKALEALLHPEVRKAMETARAEAAENGTQLFIAEIPLFYEAGFALPVDLVILVAAGDAFQRQRMMDSRGLDAATAQRILSAQLPLERKLELAPVVIWNEGTTEMLQAQAKVLLQQLTDS